MHSEHFRRAPIMYESPLKMTQAAEKIPAYFIHAVLFV